MFFLLISTAAKAQVFKGSNYGASLCMRESSEVLSGAVLNYDSIFIKSTLYLQNRGRISSDIYIENGFTLSYSGYAPEGRFFMGQGSTLRQIVTAAEDISKLSIVRNVNDFFIILVRDAIELDMTALLAIAEKADEIIIENSTFVNLPDQLSDIVLSKENVIITGASGASLSGKGDGALSARASSLKLFYPYVDKSNGQLVIKLLRETDYEKAIGGDLGKFLNDLRVKDPNSELLKKLDAAQSEEEFYAVMKSSATFNPTLISRPIRAFEYSIADSTLLRRCKGCGWEVLAKGHYLNFMQSNTAGGTAGVSYFGESFSVGAYAYYAGMSANEQSASIIGGMARGEISVDYVFVRTLIGKGLHNFKTGALFQNGKKISSPNSDNMFAIADFGLNLDGESFYVSPFVRVNYTEFKMLGEAEPKLSAGYGASIGMMEKFEDISSGISVFAVMGQDMWDAGVEYEMRLPSDGIGFSIGGGAIKMFDNVGWKANLSARVSF
jgi:hypothetical protein